MKETKSGTKTRRYTRKQVDDLKKIQDPELREMVEHSIIDEMRDNKPKTPFTRFELPDGIDILEYPKASDSVVKYKRHSTMLFSCNDIESARKLRTELLYSLELLNFYIDQAEGPEGIRYLR